MGEGRQCPAGAAMLPPPPAGPCDFVAYCNKYPDLANAFCGGGPCTQAHAAQCQNHWNVHGMGEGRECPAGAAMPPPPPAMPPAPPAMPPAPPAMPPASPAVTCNPQAGDGSGGTEEFLLTTPTMQACAEYVAQNRPTANAATWGRTNQKCYAESGQTGVRPSTEWMNCYVTPAAGPPASPAMPPAPPAMPPAPPAMPPASPAV